MPRFTKVDPTNGPITPAVLKYAFPVFLSAIIQNLMTAADTAVLGNMADSVAVASVGATGSIIALLVASMSGVAEGGKIMIARAYGARDYSKCKSVMNTSLIVAASLGVLVAVFGLIFARPILSSMNCPDDCIDGAAAYLSIYFLSAPLTLIYNFGAGIIAISGDSVKPMKYMLISGVSNLTLNIILCLLLQNKVVAVAVATVVGTSISTVLVIRDLLKHDKFALDIKHLNFNPGECLTVFRYGIPMAFNTALYAFSNVQIQSAINSFGSAAIAGNVSAGYLESFLTCITSSFYSATAVFVGQNLGAKNEKRVDKSIIVCTSFCSCIAEALALVVLFFGKSLLSIFIPGDAAAIAFATVRMKYILPIYAVAAVNGCLSSTIQAFGYTYIPTANSIFSVLVLRIVWMELIFPKSPTPDTLYFCYTVSWILSFLICSIAFTVIYSRFKKGKLSQI